MAAIPSNLTSLDFSEIRESIRSYLRTRDEFTDYDFDGSAASYLLDVLSYNTYYASFNANMAMNEAFLESATIRDNVVKIAKQLNYTPRSVKAPKACVQFAVQTALSDKESTKKLTLPGGRLKDQRDVTWELLNQIPGISCVKPMGAIYLFPKLDQKFFNIEDDEKLILNILEQGKILLVQGSAFNISDKQHFRIVFLPEVDQLAKAINQVSTVLDSYRKS